MIFISDYIQHKVDEGQKTKDIALELGITPAMVGQYRLKRGYNPSLPVAKKVFLLDGVTLHPYSQKSLEWEIENV